MSVIMFRAAVVRLLRRSSSYYKLIEEVEVFEYLFGIFK